MKPRILQQPVYKPQEEWRPPHARNIRDLSGTGGRSNFESSPLASAEPAHLFLGSQAGTGLGSELLWESSSNFSSSPPWTPNAEKATIIEEQFTHEAEKMDCNITADKTRSSEFKFLETETTEMEWPVIHPGSTRNGGVYRCKRRRLGDSYWIKILLRNVSSFPDIPTYKREEAISFIKSSSPKEMQQHLLVFTMEYDLANYSESKKRKTHNYNSDLVVGISSLVPKNIGNVDKKSTEDTGNEGYSRPSKRKIAFNQEKNLVSGRIED
ncbi:hypothetical protein AYI69_g604 [Smittium culicis]|uniref:Uncharacterized protein n=1 Tax=Smittium culicis TaxID=133412 RepID=A0A1R1YSJ3_9FUNG|nr:hypothetical protein AYI69_g604 [Smittium culicis]